MEQPIQLSSLSDDNNNSSQIDLDHHNSLASQASRSILPGELVIQKICYLREERVPTICERASVKNGFHYIGVVREFRIEMKTFNEIKTGDDTQCFYMPYHNTKSSEGGIEVNLSKSDNEMKTKTAETAATTNELRCTSFRKLRENPNVLVQQLHPKQTVRPFNLLEQDTTLLINSLAHGDPYSTTSIQKKHRKTGGATAFDPTTRLQSAHDGLSVSSQTFSLSQLPRVVQSLPMNRRRRPRQVAPCGCRDLEPKIHLHLLKTVAVGILQIAVFLILVMALSYPDIRC
ncbi:uncharacterized protein LOC111519860 [Drosophila willistoni]|uniref:uncharacterized protein LOC111519860 n=1 Tax=Drosophila willistoni TaxID=7260 RepID=UPI00017D64B5|nr:uncharacterized protein LOC111519860 [Drosophila willistoni]XP_023037933.1 uncharacterized protein LOC111519860 [Drosophila willistoni]